MPEETSLLKNARTVDTLSREGPLAVTTTPTSERTHARVERY